MAQLALESDSFANGQAIPERHTCDGEDVSPPLRWSGAPKGTRSLAFLVVDPDAPSGVFTHWVAWGLDPAAAGLREGEGAANEGRNDFGTRGYRGPCPPPGHGRHRYVFRLFALGSAPRVLPGASKAELEQAIAEDVLTTAELVGTYEREAR